MIIKTTPDWEQAISAESGKQEEVISNGLV